MGEIRNRLNQLAPPMGKNDISLQDMIDDERALEEHRRIPPGRFILIGDKTFQTDDMNIVVKTALLQALELRNLRTIVMHSKGPFGMIEVYDEMPPGSKRAFPNIEKSPRYKDMSKEV